MKINLDRVRCEGHGMCEALAPSFFSVDDEGTLTILHDEVSDRDEDDVRTATLGCPVAALKLI